MAWEREVVGGESSLIAPGWVLAVDIWLVGDSGGMAEQPGCLRTVLEA